MAQGIWQVCRLLFLVIFLKLIVKLLQHEVHWVGEPKLTLVPETISTPFFAWFKACSIVMSADRASPSS